MSRRLRRHLENQAQVKVGTKAHGDALNTGWFLTLAALFAGAFYFFGYYFWEHLWRVLTGG